MSFPLQRRYRAGVQPVGTTASTLTPVDSAVEAETVSSVSYIPTSTQAGAATNNRAFTLFNRGTAGTGTVSVASLTLVSGTDLTDNVARAITLSTTSANLLLVAGDVLEWSSTPNGTGLPDPGGLVKVTTTRTIS